MRPEDFEDDGDKKWHLPFTVNIGPRGRYALWGLGLLLYAFIAARPVPPELVFSPVWLKSLVSSYAGNAGAPLVPFAVGKYFGYVSQDGVFSLLREKTGYLEQSDTQFAEFSGQPNEIAFISPLGKRLSVLKKPSGYPFFRDGHAFVISREQNAISMLSQDNETLWRYDYSAPVLCADAAAGMLAAGALDGSITILDYTGHLVHRTEPSGSRIPIIVGCALSPDGRKVALVSGIDQQRFLLITHEGGAWRISHHEFIGEGFRRPVPMRFVGGSRYVVYECAGGVGIYDSYTFSSRRVPLQGRVMSVADSPADKMFFVIDAVGARDRSLVAVQYGGSVVITAPFTSDDSFLRFEAGALYWGGSGKLAAFRLDKR
jgi:hypothetical protein